MSGVGRRFTAGGLARVLPLLLLLCTLAGCSEDAEDFAVAPGLVPRASRILRIEPGGFFAGRTCWVYLPAGHMEPRRSFPRPGHGRYSPMIFTSTRLSRMPSNSP